MTAFDPIKAAREELTGLADIRMAIRQRERSAMHQISEAERELQAIRKLAGFCDIEIDRKREQIRKLEAELQGET